MMTRAPWPRKRLRAALADVAIAADHCDLSGNHDVERAIQAVDERMAADVKIVEFRFGDRIIHVDRWDEELILLLHFVKAMHAGGGFLRYAAPFLYELVPAQRILALRLLGADP